MVSPSRDDRMNRRTFEDDTVSSDVAGSFLYNRCWIVSRRDLGDQMERTNSPRISFGGSTTPSGGLFASSGRVGVLPLVAEEVMMNTADSGQWAEGRGEFSS